MKRTVLALCALLLVAVTCFTSCSKKNDRDAVDGFYAKTPSSSGDRTVSEVIDIETEKRTYEGEGDLRVPATVGFGHLPEVRGDGEEYLRVEYLIIEAPWAADKRPSWEMVTDYEVSWYDEMFNSTEKKEGDFSPLFKEEVTLTFPKEVEKGYLEIRLYTVKEGRDNLQFADLRVYFERKDGVLTLDPHGD